MSIDTTRYRYRAFGLNIESELRLDGLLPSDGPTEVQVRYGKVDVPFPGPAGENAYWAEGKRKFAFRVKNIGSFLIRDGVEVVVDLDEHQKSEAHPLYVLGTCSGVLLMQRGLLPIHGSALSLEGKEVIITGHSGAGKSTLTAALSGKGYRFLADDIAAVQVEGDGTPWIMPAFPRQKLWRDAAEHLHGSVDVYERIPGIRDKFHIPMAKQFISSKRRLRALFEISVHGGEKVEWSEAAGTEKLEILLRSTYRLELVGALGIGAWHFQQCASVASNVAVFKLRRPESSYTLEQQTEAVLEALEQL